MSIDCYIDLEYTEAGGHSLDETIRIGHNGLLNGTYTEFKLWDTLWYLSHVRNELTDETIGTICSLFDCLEYSLEFTPSPSISKNWNHAGFREEWRSLKKDYISSTDLSKKLFLFLNKWEAGRGKITWNVRVD